LDANTGAIIFKSIDFARDQHLTITIVKIATDADQQGITDIQRIIGSDDISVHLRNTVWINIEVQANGIQCITCADGVINIVCDRKTTLR